MDIKFKLIDPDRNCRRLYVMKEMRTLFGELCLLITWGRIGTRCRTRTEVFENRRDFVRRRDELLKRRLSHGYVCEIV